MRVLIALFCLSLLCACVADDSIKNRQYGQQYVCHNHRTLAVSTADLFVHQSHGDTVGPCPD
jgi:hypothetical protein